MIPGDQHTRIHYGQRPAEDNLNINDWVKYFMICALNKTKSKDEAAYKLGITTRTLYRYMQYFNIRRQNKKEGKYFFVDRKRLRIVRSYSMSQN